MSDAGSSLPSVELLEQQLESLAQYTTKLQERLDTMAELFKLLAESHSSLRIAYQGAEATLAHLIARENGKCSAVNQLTGGYTPMISPLPMVPDLPQKLTDYLNGDLSA